MNFKLINLVVILCISENMQYLFLVNGERPDIKNVDNIVHRNAWRSGGRYFATRLRTTRAIRTQLLFHPIVRIFFVVSFSRLLRYSCSLALNVPVFHSFCILSAILVREHLFDSFLVQRHSYMLSLLNPVSGVLNSTDWKNDFRGA